MPVNDFARLSPADFEELISDLLSAAWGKRLERFTAGRDSGIDLRCLSLEGSIVVQCKHAPATNFRNLLSVIRKTELPKIQALKPARYVLVTSVGLTPGNKKTLFDLLSPYVISEDDIMGREQINDLIRQYPEVEVANFKLWFTSAAVLKRVLHNAQVVQTEFEVDRIAERIPLFVQSESYPRACKILDDTRIVVISGTPGIGKTTLAEMLMFAHLEQGFEPVVARSSVADARVLFDKSKKQIFYFDDFLGQTFLHDRPDFLDKNQDAELVSLMDAIRRTKHSRFILTTREHILRSALGSSERLSNSPILMHKCVIELDDYTFDQKARILYNHLYFGDLPKQYMEEILKDDFFLEIIKHKNFTPRIVEWLSGYLRVRRVPLSEYQAHVKNLLESPAAIWQHAFSNQITAASQSLLVALVSFGQFANFGSVQEAWGQLHQRRVARYKIASGPDDFRRSLEELEGSFIKITPFGIDFFNPSIRDFLQDLLRQSEDYVTDLLAALVHFRQVELVREVAVVSEHEPVRRLVSPDSRSFSDAVMRALDSPHMRWERRASGSVGTYIDTAPEYRLSWLIALTEELKLSSALALVEAAFVKLRAGWQVGLPDVGPLVQLLKVLDGANWVAQADKHQMRRTVLDAVLGSLRYCRVYDWDNLLEYQGSGAPWSDEDEATLSAELTWYQEDGAWQEMGECSTDSELSELREGLQNLQKVYGLEFEGVVSSLEDKIAEQEEGGSGGYSGSRYMGSSITSENKKVEAPDDDRIRGLFQSLK